MQQPAEKPENNCHFCRKEITNKSFCTTPQFSAFYNIAPVLAGHSLVIPKKHYQSLFELSEEELAEMMLFARKITAVLKTVFECDGFDWTIQDGISAGQTVPHLHLHIIPRKIMDLPPDEEWYGKVRENEKNLLDSLHRERLGEAEYDEITLMLREACINQKVE